MPPTSYPLVVVDATPDSCDALIGRLTMLGAEAIEERDATTLDRPGASGVTLVASFATFEDARAAAAEIGGSARVEQIVGDAWRDAWREHWKPTRIGSRIVIVPSWMEYQASPDDEVLRLDPGRAFGTGQHATTALVIESLERIVTVQVTDLILDLGCGSGILAFAALRLGVPRAIGCDADADAVASARENATQLGLGLRSEFRVGSVDVIAERAPIVVANIEASVLVPNADAIASRVGPGGTLVLSGILATQRDAVEQAYRRSGLVAGEYTARDEWIAPVFRRAP